jgi:hypothetical protein
MAKAPDCQFCGAHAYGKLKDTYHTSCGTYHMVSDGRVLRSPECKHSQLRQVVREAVVRLGKLEHTDLLDSPGYVYGVITAAIEDLREAVGDDD